MKYNTEVTFVLRTYYHEGKEVRSDVICTFHINKCVFHTTSHAPRYLMPWFREMNTPESKFDYYTGKPIE